MSGQVSCVFQKDVRIYFILLSISVVLFYEYFQLSVVFISWIEK